MERGLRWFIIGSVAIGLLSAVLSALLSETPVISLISLLKYFTIWSNIFVILYFLLMNKKLRLVAWLKGSVYVNITLTMIVFVGVLSFVYHPRGLDLVTSFMHHYVVPVAALLYLFFYESEQDISLSRFKVWIIFPVIYLSFSLIYYVWTFDAIYPFMDVRQIGVFLYLLTLLGMIIMYYALSFGLVKIVSRK
jgi:hypothetical protein